jgi:cytochrome c553
MNLQQFWKLFILMGTFGLSSASAFAQVDEARVNRIISGSCFICHGPTGHHTTELIPKLAGQNAEYIARQLANFKNGTRVSKEMAEMSSKLSSEEMLALGKFFEKQN